MSYLRLIFFTSALLFFGALFAMPVHAAVPVAVVQFDAGTDYETSVLHFLGKLLDKLAQKQMESAAAFELLKVEKAREDVNKLVQETQEELTDYGIILAYPDPRLTSDPGCVADPARCDAQRGDEAANGPYYQSLEQAEAELTISPFKDSRIIHNVFDYIYEEPLQQARVYTQCFFNMYIWHQAGYQKEMEEAIFGKSLDSPPTGCQSGSQELCTYGRSSIQSINNIRSRRDAMMLGLRRSNQYMVDYPQIFLFGDWSGYSEADRYGLRERGESGNPALRRASMRNCSRILANSSGITPSLPDPGPRFQNVPVGSLSKEFTQILPTLGKTTSGRGNSWFDLALARENRNTLNGITGLAIQEVTRILAETQNERELTYLAGQGIRPERLYEEISGEDPAYAGLGQFSPGSQKLSYYHDTGYIVSPAVVLLQKMQAANQAMFDLAQKSFLYLDPERSSLEILNRYNVRTNADTCFREDGSSAPCPNLTGFFERTVCNVVPNNPTGTHCFAIQPWLIPGGTGSSFKSAPDTTRVGGRKLKQSEDSPFSILASEAGLPAPWEDENPYVALGNERIGARPYSISQYRGGSPLLAPGQPFGGVGTDKGDNIASKVLGADYAINDWYDRVFEMYAPNRSALTFTIPDWDCYLATWFFFPGFERIADPAGVVPDFYSSSSVRTHPIQSVKDIAQDPDRLQGSLPDRFTTSVSTKGGGTTLERSLNDAQIQQYCGQRISDLSY